MLADGPTNTRLPCGCDVLGELFEPAPIGVSTTPMRTTLSLLRASTPDAEPAGQPLASRANERSTAKLSAGCARCVRCHVVM